MRFSKVLQKLLRFFNSTNLPLSPLLPVICCLNISEEMILAAGKSATVLLASKMVYVYSIAINLLMFQVIITILY